MGVSESKLRKQFPTFIHDWIKNGIPDSVFLEKCFNKFCFHVFQNEGMQILLSEGMFEVFQKSQPKFIGEILDNFMTERTFLNKKTRKAFCKLVENSSVLSPWTHNRTICLIIEHYLTHFQTIYLDDEMIGILFGYLFKLILTTPNRSTHTDTCRSCKNVENLPIAKSVTIKLFSLNVMDDNIYLQPGKLLINNFKLFSSNQESFRVIVNLFERFSDSLTDEEFETIFRQTLFIEDVKLMKRATETLLKHQESQKFQAQFEWLLNLNGELSKISHRNKCLFTLEVLKTEPNFLSELNKRKLSEYLLEQVDKSVNGIETALFALLAMERLLLVNDYKKYSIDQENLRKFITDNAYHLNSDNKLSFLKTNHDNLIFDGSVKEFAKYEFEFCCSWLAIHLENHAESNQLAEGTVQTLDTKLKTPHLKLSPDLLSARSDWKWQSVCSFCKVQKSGCYYYEATILTDGEMRIGFSTKNTLLQAELVGGDECSIGFDGFNKCVWHDGQMVPIELVGGWKIGDVVGCWVDLEKQIFGFSINSKVIYDTTKEGSNFCGHSYAAAISLSEHQQVRVNFRQEPFQFRPKYLDVLDFKYDCGVPCGDNSNNMNLTNSIYNTGELQVGSFRAEQIVNEFPNKRQKPN